MHKLPFLSSLSLDTIKHALYKRVLAMVDYFRERRSYIIHYFLLATILSLAFYVNFLPHKDYKLPLHVDEWRHFAESQAILDAQNVTFIEPYMGAWTVDDLETGFHLFLAGFKEITGMDWVSIFVYLPSVIFVFTILAVYIFANRFGYGLEAAFIAAFFPTDVRLLGPVFLVPVSLGLFFMALSLFLVFHVKSRYMPFVLIVFVTYLFLMHPPTAVVAIVALLPYIILRAIKDKKHRIYIFSILVLAAIVILNSKYGSLVHSTLAEIAAPGRPWLPYAPEVFKTFGYLPTVLFIAGIFFMALEWTYESRALILSFVALIMIVVVFARLNLATGINEIIYSRTYLYTILLMGFFGGFGLFSIRSGIKNLIEKKGLRYSGIASAIVSIIIVLSVLASVVPLRGETEYYHVISDSEYNDFLWIKENVRGDRAILNPWNAIAFTPVTGKEVYSKIPQAVDEFSYQRVQRTYAFLSNGCADTDFLKQNNISIVYGQCSNPDLQNVRPNIYIVKN